MRFECGKLFYGRISTSFDLKRKFRIFDKINLTTVNENLPQQSNS